MGEERTQRCADRRADADVFKDSFKIGIRMSSRGLPVVISGRHADDGETSGKFAKPRTHATFQVLRST